VTGNSAEASTSGEGIFYRRHLPYKVTVINKAKDENQTKDESSRDFIAFSPNESPIYFLPFPKSFLADTKADAKLGTDGGLTNFDVTDESEALALLTLPADIIGAYFGAIGKMFDWQKGALAKEKEYLGALNDLSVEKLKSENCQSAIKAAGTEITEAINVACGVKR
jgi:hypothetical protein